MPISYGIWLWKSQCLGSTLCSPPVALSVAPPCPSERKEAKRDDPSASLFSSFLFKLGLPWASHSFTQSQDLFSLSFTTNVNLSRLELRSEPIQIKLSLSELETIETETYFLPPAIRIMSQTSRRTHLLKCVTLLVEQDWNIGHTPWKIPWAPGSSFCCAWPSPAVAPVFF